MKKLVFIFTVAILFFSCNTDLVKKPDNLIDKRKMGDILYDMSLLEALKYQNPNSLYENGINPKTYVFKKYKIDSITYSQNQRYYASDSRKYKKIYKKVIERLDLEQKKMNDTTKATNASDDVKKSFSVSE